VHGATPAPYRALDLIEGSATWSLEQGYRAEEDALAELLPGREAQASVYAFNLVERRAKRGVGMPDAEPRRVQTVGIVGAGLMARQLALLFVRRLEIPVVLRDLTQEQVDEGIAWIHDELTDLVKRGRLGEGKARFLGSIVTGSTDWAVFAGCDLVLEAVFEEIAVKKEVFAALERVVAPECVLATNTSSLSVTEMGADLDHPERVVGMHFFNPAPVMRLVEVIRGSETSDATTRLIRDLCGRLGKEPVEVRESPGFVVNRLLVPMVNEAFNLLQEGVASAEDIDKAMKLGTNMPMGPFELADYTGLDIGLDVMEVLYRETGDPKFRPSPLLRKYVRAGRLGRKAGRGVYDYPTV
jgi:3-hydroxyacyl-CoA dehydrogenase